MVQNTTDLRGVTLAILAGGAGTRMGKPKAWLEVNGVPILRRIHETLHWPGPTMIVTVEHRRGAPATELFDREVVDAKEEGPLRGVLTALEHAATDRVIVNPVDMPNLRQEHLQWMVNYLAENPRIVGVMMRHNEIEPLPFCVRQEAVRDISSRLLTDNHSLRALTTLPGFAVTQVPAEWPDEIWHNLNTPRDL